MSLRVALRTLAHLTKAKQLSAIDKAIYTVAMLQQPSCVAELALAVGLHKATMDPHLKNLERLGWLRIVPVGRCHRPEAVVPADVEQTLANETRRLMRVAPFLGEETSKRFVDWIVAPFVHLVYNSRPSFLENKDTGQKMEYDVHAPDYAWALEHQGDQHFGPTSKYPNDKAFVDQYRRDIRKAYLSKQNGVRLSTVTYLDLTLEGMQAAIPRDIPRRPFDPKGPYIVMLEELGRGLAGPQAP